MRNDVMSHYILDLIVDNADRSSNVVLIAMDTYQMIYLEFQPSPTTRFRKYNNDIKSAYIARFRTFTRAKSDLVGRDDSVLGYRLWYFIVYIWNNCMDKYISDKQITLTSSTYTFSLIFLLLNIQSSPSEL